MAVRCPSTHPSPPLTIYIPQALHLADPFPYQTYPSRRPNHHRPHHLRRPPFHHLSLVRPPPPTRPVLHPYLPNLHPNRLPRPRQMVHPPSNAALSPPLPPLPRRSPPLPQHSRPPHPPPHNLHHRRRRHVVGVILPLQLPPPPHHPPSKTLVSGRLPRRPVGLLGTAVRPCQFPVQREAERRQRVESGRQAGMVEGRQERRRLCFRGGADVGERDL